MLELESDPYSLFIYGLRSPKTREKCIRRLRAFFDFIQITEGDMAQRSKVFFDKVKSENGSAWVLANLLKYFQYQKERFERKEIVAGTFKNYYQAVKSFCDMNNLKDIPWITLRKDLPKVRRSADDRAPTIEEIRKIIEYPDRRIKAIVCIMASSGIRVGAWDYLKFKHIIPLERAGQIVAAKLIVYAGEYDEHFTFITPEAYFELEKWKKYRIQSGEVVNAESWVMRNIWNTKKGAARGLVSVPVKLQSEGVKRLVEDALWTQGLRTKLDQNKKRHEFQTDHGFRKFFKTHCELSRVNSLHIEILMNHSMGIADSYMKPTEENLLQDYLNGVDNLTISTEYMQRKNVEKIKQERKDSEYIIKGKLQESESEIQDLKKQIRLMEASQADFQKVFLECLKFRR